MKEAYDKFLEEYPLCYVYWKNYAERIEELTKDFEEARKIYERSTGPLRYSEANWYNYVSFCGDRALKALESLNVFQAPSGSAATANGSELSTAKLSSIARETFEKAIDAVGIDFSAQEIWSKYIDFEVASCDFKRVVDLFNRALSIPMNNLENVWNKYRIYAQGRPLEDVLTTEELSAHKAKVAGAASEGADAAKRLEIETIKSVIDKRELIYKKTLAEVEKRMSYEKVALNRSYFHVMPMSPDSLANWRAYLRWEEQQEKPSEGAPATAAVAGKRTVQLYERCLIPCCACQEFWFMYVDYLQRHGDEDSVKRVFDRATKVYFKNVPSFFLKYALFEEANSRTYKADDIYSTLLARVPGHIEATLKYAAFLRRRGDEAKCRDVLEKGVASVPQGKPRQKALLMVHLAKFFEQTEKTSLARSTYSELTRLCGNVLEGWMCAIDFEVNEIKLCASAGEKEKIEKRINALFHNALIDSCGLSMADKKKLWVSWTEVSADCGFSIKTISAVEADYSIVLSGSFPDWTHTDSEFPLDLNAQENGGAARAPIEEELLPPGKKQKIVGDAK